MSCTYLDCAESAKWRPLVRVWPAKGEGRFHLDPMTVIPMSFGFCDAHRTAFGIESFSGDGLKTLAKSLRKKGFPTPDWERAQVWFAEDSVEPDDG